MSPAAVISSVGTAICGKRSSSGSNCHCAIMPKVPSICRVRLTRRRYISTPSASSGDPIPAKSRATCARDDDSRVTTAAAKGPVAMARASFGNSQPAKPSNGPSAALIPTTARGGRGMISAMRKRHRRARRMADNRCGPPALIGAERGEVIRHGIQPQPQMTARARIALPRQVGHDQAGSRADAGPTGENCAPTPPPRAASAHPAPAPWSAHARHAGDSASCASGRARASHREAPAWSTPPRPRPASRPSRAHRRAAARSAWPPWSPPVLTAAAWGAGLCR